MTLTKDQLTDSLVGTLRFPKDSQKKELSTTLKKTISRKLVDDFFEEIKVALAEGDEVKLSGFGNFESREKAARPGRNPKTGEVAIVSARRVVTFKAGRKLRERVEQAKSKA